jgi:hypothetical protein
MVGWPEDLRSLVRGRRGRCAVVGGTTAEDRDIDLPDRIVIQTVWQPSGPRTYQFDQVAEVFEVDCFKAPNGSIVDRPHFVIRFADGEEWSTRDFGNGRDPDPPHDRLAVGFVAIRAGKQIQHRGSM